LPAGPRLAPFIAANGDKVLPGFYGVSYGAGITGELISPAGLYNVIARRA
jgi:hypothetical protein